MKFILDRCVMTYEKANTDWLVSCALGISTHWTAQTAPSKGTALSFQDAVDHFQLNKFITAVEESGANYVIFTAAHALQMLPCPNPVVDSILAGRTTERDLIGEIANSLAAINKSLIVYYNHSCNSGDDPAWEQAVGYHDQRKDRLTENLCAIVRWMGERYGQSVRAWWFDSAYSLDPSGPHNSVTTDMTGFQFPWEQFTVAAKAGYAGRLVTYNAGIGETFMYTQHQDYWSGEMVNLNILPASRFTETGLQWHGWACLEDRTWVYGNNSTKPHLPLYSDDEILRYVTICRQHQAPMCFNVLSFQDGSMAENSVRQLGRITEGLKSRMGTPEG